MRSVRCGRRSPSRWRLLFPFPRARCFSFPYSVRLSRAVGPLVVYALIDDGRIIFVRARKGVSFAKVSENIVYSIF